MSSCQNRHPHPSTDRDGIAAADAIDDLRDHRVTVRAEDLAGMVDTLRDALSTPQVASMTGIPKLHLVTLIAEGHLPTITGTKGLAYAKHRFTRTAVDDLMKRLFAGAEVVLGETERRVTVMRARQMAGASNEAMLAMILDGSLAWKGRIGTDGDYGTLLVDADELTRRVRVEGPRLNYTKEEIADAVPGIDRSKVDRLAAEGLLEIVEEFSTEARRMIPVVSRESADAFLKRFVSLGELTRSTGLHHKKVRLLLRGVDIAAAVDPDAIGVFLYDRAAVDRVVGERPDFWKYDKKAALAAAR